MKSLEEPSDCEDPEKPGGHRQRRRCLAGLIGVKQLARKTLSSQEKPEAR